MERALSKPLDVPADTALRREFGPLTRKIAALWFVDVRFPLDGEQELRELHEKGFVVHVMRTTAWINYLYLTWALIRRGLPPVRAVVNLRPWFSRPWRNTAQRGEFDVRFTYARRQGGSGLIFLRRTVFAAPHGKIIKEDPFPALVAMARKSERTVFLVPELFVWEKWNTRIKPVLADYVFGSPEAPGFLHTLVAFWRNRRRAQFRVGEPINLKAFIEENPLDSDEKIARKVRGALNHHLARETRAVFGPPFKPRDRVIEETLRDRSLRRTIDEVAAESHRAQALVEHDARKNLDSIVSRLYPPMVALTSPVLDAVFNRIYDGIEVDEVGLSRALKAASQTPLVFCPSHKSHVDYLVLSWVLWKRGNSVPLVAAGANLSFFPLGPYLRRVGAFFLRRSFKGDKLYTASFKAYIRKLVRDGAHQEFFLEGSRSRTGKLLQPKFGILSWEVEAVLEGARDDLTFVPVSIDYEKVVESSSYSSELTGGDKKPENIRGLLQTPRVLASNYGRIHLTFGEPMSLALFLQGRGIRPGNPVDEEQRKAAVRALGHRLMYGISRVSTVTPHALLSAALLAQRGGGVRAECLSERVRLLRQIAGSEGSPLSVSLTNSPSDPTVMGSVQDAMRTFSSDGLVMTSEDASGLLFSPVYDRRWQLSFHKNTLMNLVAARSLVASALLVSSGATPYADVKARALWLSRLFKMEFIYRVGTSFDTLFSETVGKLVSLGLILNAGALLSVAPERHGRPELEFLADLIQDFLESYLLAALALGQLAKGQPVEKKAFVKLALDIGRAELSAGHLEAPESLSRPTLENAVGFLIDQRYLTERGREVTLSPAAEDGARRTALTEDIRAFLPQRRGTNPPSPL